MPIGPQKFETCPVWGANSGTSRPDAIRLILLWAFQTRLLEWPHLTATPAWIRTLHLTSIANESALAIMCANFQMAAKTVTPWGLEIEI
jgi:hypothetical protein